MPESPRSIDLRLTVPGDVAYRGLAAEVAARFAEYSGADVGVAVELGKAVERLATHVGNGTQPIDFELTSEDAVLTVRASSGGRRDETTCPLPE